LGADKCRQQTHNSIKDKLKVNISNLSKAIQSKISSSNNAQELLYLSKAIEKLNLGLITTVNTFSNLPSSANNGDVIFVDDDQKLYFFNSTEKWLPIFDSLVLGKAWSWGSGFLGQLGDNTTAQRSSPVSVVGEFTNWVQISAGSNHTAALRANGTAWAWGSAGQGRLGGNTILNKSSPVLVVGGFTNWVQISAGSEQTAALRANGTAWTWGRNNEGQLGDNTILARSSPVLVVGGFTDWVQISTGGDHTAALRSNGTAWAWGSGFLGQLGDNTNTNRSSPVSVVGGFTDWVQISAGGNHTAALRANGTAWGWGFGTSGQLGDNTTTTRSSPVSVVGGFTDWVQISTGSTHTAALRANGTAWGWGTNSSGQLGDNTNTNRSSPVSVVGGFTDWVQISSGNFQTLAVRANGTAWAWGFNGNGSLGDNTTTTRSSPVSVVGEFTDWVQISAGGGHTATIKLA